MKEEYNTKKAILVILDTLLLPLLAVRVQQVLRLQVGSSDREVHVVFVISLDVSVIPPN